MIHYVRPPVVVEQFLDDDGVVIDYGNRWADRGWDGPDDTYSACGCDHCDDDVLTLVDDLEESVSAIVAGRLTEWDHGFELRHRDGTEWMSGGDGDWDLSGHTVDAPDATVWAAWRLRSR